jgi:hypothetical protein
LKRISAILSILFMFATSTVSHAGCCFYILQNCPAKASAASERCYEEESGQLAGCGGTTGNTGCRAKNACRESVDTNGVEDCGPKKDCKPRCYQLIPPIIADGPNRLILHNSDNAESGIITIQIILAAVLPTKILDAIPPWGIHPGITTTILRI